MSRAFVKEPDGSEPPEALPDLPIPSDPNLVTARGLQQIEQMIVQLGSSFSALPATEQAQRQLVARDLRYWMARRDTAQLQPAPMQYDYVAFGHQVTLMQDDGRVRKFIIVGFDEADAKAGRIYYMAPLAQALLEQGLGDRVEIGAIKGEITAIGLPAA